MATTLYLIRHGETEGSETKRYKGSIDVPLSEHGIAQIKKVSAYIAGRLQEAEAAMQKSYLNDIHSTFGAMPDNGLSKLSAVYCSDLSRAIKSAEIIAAPHGLEPIVVPELRERNFGVWEGMSFNEIKERYPSEFEAWASDPLKHSPVNGESTEDVHKRAIRAFDSVMGKYSAESPSAHIAVVAHGGVNRTILCHLMGVPLENIFRIEQDHAAVNIIEFWGLYPVIKLLNGGPLD
ncbi:MAG: histidine phosphatase family protein [Nitrospirae bacterium]|nr:histidine phosphatase family protein [Nitrospirota bacterium]